MKKLNHLTIKSYFAGKPFRHISSVNRLIGYSVIRFFLVLFTFYLLPFTFTDRVYALDCNTYVPDETEERCPSNCPYPNYNSESHLLICLTTKDPTSGSSGYINTAPGAIKNPALDPLVGEGEGNVILAKLLAAVINLFFIAGSVAVLVFFLIGGLAWITSEGDKGKMELAKNRLTYAGVGIVIIAATYAILQILGLFLGISFFKGLIITWPTLTGP